MNLIAEQMLVCAKYQTQFLCCDLALKVGISAGVKQGLRPLHGVRLPETISTSGWYIWAGYEWSNADDFYLPLCGIHVVEWEPLLPKYLALPVGWRFLASEDYEDVWFEPHAIATAVPNV
jgi:hypothetical protein